MQIPNPRYLNVIVPIITAVIGFASGLMTNLTAIKVGTDTNGTVIQTTTATIRSNEQIENDKREQTTKDSIILRLSQATTKLQSKNSGERIAASREMEMIFKESQKDRWVIVSTIAASITANSIILKPSNANKKIPLDIQTALDIIKIRNPEDDNYDKSPTEDRIVGLSDANLSGADLEKGKFPGAAFNRSILNDANFRETNLKGAYFTGSQLIGADFTNADLSGASLYDKNGHTRTDLTIALLDNTNLNGANLTGVRFFKDKLKGSALKKAKSDTEQKIKKACNWNLAIYDPEISKMLNQDKTSKELDSRTDCKRFIPGL
jgi:hypothetical protein